MMFDQQEKLKSALDSYTIQTLPKTLMLIGDYGCGKSYYAKNLAERLRLKTIEIDTKVEQDTMNAYRISPIDTMYIINLVNFTEKAQNQFLKFIEEPGEHVYVMLFSRSEVGVLPTILNRCVKLTFEPYTKDFLKNEFAGTISNDFDDDIYEVAKTPGQLQAIIQDVESFKKAKELCSKIVDNIDKAPYANTMSLALKINYKDYYDKCDFDLFFRLMEYLAYTKYITTYSSIAYHIYKITNKYNKDKLNKTVAKEAYVLNYLTALWKGTH